ncbi:MAG: 30S ribosomal protein S18 [Rhizobacter sp.]|nr:30S ribosomal protein S18 [Chlorobiales bacterium]
MALERKPAPGGRGGAAGSGRPGQRNAQQNQRKRAVPNKNQVIFFDYRDDRKLRRFINEQGKIIPRRVTGLTAREQRLLTKSIKWARHLAIIPFVSDQIK